MRRSQLVLGVGPFLPHPARLSRFCDGGSEGECVAPPGFKYIAEVLNHGGDVDEEEGCTPLISAATAGDIVSVNMLLAVDGINVNAMSHCGWSPLHHAAGGYTGYLRHVCGVEGEPGISCSHPRLQ